MKLCGFEAGLDQPLFLIAGPCVIESRGLQVEVAGKLYKDDINRLTKLHERPAERAARISFKSSARL